MFVSHERKGGQNHNIVTNKPSENVTVQTFGSGTNKHEEIDVRNALCPCPLRM